MGHFWFWDTFNFGTLLIFEHLILCHVIWILDTFDFGTLLILEHLILGHFWFWDTFDFGKVLILGYFWFWDTFVSGHFYFLDTFDFWTLLIFGYFWFLEPLYFLTLLIIGYFWFLEHILYFDIWSLDWSPGLTSRTSQLIATAQDNLVIVTCYWLALTEDVGPNVAILGLLNPLVIVTRLVSGMDTTYKSVYFLAEMSIW